MKRMYRYFLFLTFCFLVSACNPAMVVNSNGDGEDTNVGDRKCETAQGDCTLRAAIMEANHADDANKIFFENVTVTGTETKESGVPEGCCHQVSDGIVILCDYQFFQ